MAKSKDKKAKRNIIKRISGYFGDVIGELKRVVWPTRPEVMNLSMVVIVTLLFFVAFTFVVDQASVHIVSLIARLGG